MSAAVVGTRAFGATPVKSAAKSNVIFIMAADLGYGYLGCYGQKKISTPHIDQLAGEGMKFTDFYAGYTGCAPSRSGANTSKTY